MTPQPTAVTECHGLHHSRVVRSLDGAELAAYAFGASGASPIVLINAFGMHVEFCLPFIEALANRHRVVTWESRGVPRVEGSFTPDMAAFDRHLDDLQCVMRAFGVERCHVVGWCAGARTALTAASRLPHLVDKVVCLNGAFSTPGERPMTTYERNFRKLMPRIASKRAYAEFYYKAVFARRLVQSTENDSQLGAEFIGSSDPMVRHWASRPFTSAEALYRYALLQQRFLEYPLDLAMEQVEAEVLVLTGANDLVAHPWESHAIAKRLPRVRLVEEPEGTHFALYDDPRTATRVSSFLAESR
jgi:pimeloyl-ACP methyl ester carboxylesterase